MRELRGEVTVFYSTHILDDVERVSDHVAILDGGRLVGSAATAELLSSFAQDQLLSSSVAPSWTPNSACPAAGRELCRVQPPRRGRLDVRGRDR